MENIAKFFFELGVLKNVKRSGWWLAGIKDPESVAEHSFRMTIIGRILAEMEGADINKVTTMCLFHDVAEARINDLHLVGARYIKKREAELKAFEEQMERLPENIGQELIGLMKELDERKKLMQTPLAEVYKEIIKEDAPPNKYFAIRKMGEFLEEEEFTAEEIALMRTLMKRIVKKHRGSREELLLSLYIEEKL